MNYDGTLQFNTKLDLSGFEEGLQNILSIGSGSAAISEAKAALAGVAAEFSAMPAGAKTAAEASMQAMQAALTGGAEELQTAAASAAAALLLGFEALAVQGSKNPAAAAIGYMMAGMLAAMAEGEGALYAKATSIANGIANTIRSAWQVKSPSRLFYSIMDYAMQGLYNSMQNSEHSLYQKAGYVSRQIALQFEGLQSMQPFAAAGLHALPQGVQAAAVANAAAPQTANSYSPTLVQNISSPKPLSESQLTTEAENLLRRAAWLLP